jgi:hypothetical protein
VTRGCAAPRLRAFVEVAEPQSSRSMPPRCVAEIYFVRHDSLAIMLGAREAADELVVIPARNLPGPLSPEVTAAIPLRGMLSTTWMELSDVERVSSFAREQQTVALRVHRDDAQRAADLLPHAVLRPSRDARNDDSFVELVATRSALGVYEDLLAAEMLMHWWRRRGLVSAPREN